MCALDQFERGRRESRFVVTANRGRTDGVTFTPPWLRYLGKISYGLYVFHGIALYLGVYLLGGVHTLKAFIAYWWIGLALTVAMAAVSYKYFESPFLRLKERFARVKSRPV